MRSKSSIINALMPLLLMSPLTLDVQEKIAELRAMPYHDRTKRGGKGKGSKTYRNTKRNMATSGDRECQRRLRQMAASVNVRTAYLGANA